MLDETPRPPILFACVRCMRVGRKRGWDLERRLVSPRGTAHFQGGSGTDKTVCGLDATGDKWWWPL